jgi:hypothetical protein
MGKIIYSSNLIPVYLDNMLKTDKLPDSFQKAVKSKNLDPKKLKENFNKKHPPKLDPHTVGDSFPYWKLKVIDKLDGSAPSVEITESESIAESNETSPLVIVNCEFVRWAEVQYFLNKGLHYIERYNLNRTTVGALRQEVIRQVGRVNVENMNPDDKVDVKIKYELRY